MASADGSARSDQNGQMRALEADVERYRQASTDALQQLDWCIGYFHGCGKRRLARTLARNRSHIREHLLQRPAQPVPSEQVRTSIDGV